MKFCSSSSKSSNGSKYPFLFKGGWFLLIKRLPIKVTVKPLLLLDSMEKSSKSDELLQNKCSFIRSNHRRCSVKKGVLKNFSKFIGKHLCWSLFLNKITGWGLHFIKKETPTQVLSCEFCEIFKNTFFHWTPPVVASDKRTFILQSFIQHLRAIASVLWQNGYPISISFQ